MLLGQQIVLQAIHRRALGGLAPQCGVLSHQFLVGQLLLGMGSLQRGARFGQVELHSSDAVAGLAKKIIDFGAAIGSRVPDNAACASALAAYRQALSSSATFDAWTLESIVQAILRFTDAPWTDLFCDRYLDIAKVERRVAALG